MPSPANNLPPALQNPLLDATAKADLVPSSDVLYFYEDGSAIGQRGGTRTWRNNNPGNIHYAGQREAIGQENGFAIFPTVEAGQRALDAQMLTAKYQSQTLDGLVKQYAPESENDTVAYQKFIREKLGVPGDSPVSKLSAQQLDVLKDAIRQFEGWRVGQIKP